MDAGSERRSVMIDFASIAGAPHGDVVINLELGESIKEVSR